MELSTKIVNGWNPFTNFAKSSTLDFSQGSEYAREISVTIVNLKRNRAHEDDYGNAELSSKRSSRPEVFCKNVVLKYFRNFHRNRAVSESIF